MSDHTFVIVDFIAGFGAVIAFCVWQLWDLKKAERARAAQAETFRKPDAAS